MPRVCLTNARLIITRTKFTRDIMEIYIQNNIYRFLRCSNFIKQYYIHSENFRSGGKRTNFAETGEKFRKLIATKVSWNKIRETEQRESTIEIPKLRANCDYSDLLYPGTNILPKCDLKNLLVSLFLFRHCVFEKILSLRFLFFFYFISPKKIVLCAIVFLRNSLLYSSKSRRSPQSAYLVAALSLLTHQLLVISK